MVAKGNPKAIFRKSNISSVIIHWFLIRTVNKGGTIFPGDFSFSMINAALTWRPDVKLNHEENFMELKLIANKFSGHLKFKFLTLMWIKNLECAQNIRRYHLTAEKWYFCSMSSCRKIWYNFHSFFNEKRIIHNFVNLRWIKVDIKVHLRIF